MNGTRGGICTSTKENITTNNDKNKTLDEQNHRCVLLTCHSRKTLSTSKARVIFALRSCDPPQQCYIHTVVPQYNSSTCEAPFDVEVISDELEKRRRRSAGRTLFVLRAITAHIKNDGHKTAKRKSWVSGWRPKPRTNPHEPKEGRRTGEGGRGR